MRFHQRLKIYIVIIVLFGLIAGGILGWRYIHQPQVLPIRTVKVEGQYQYVSADALKLTLLPYVQAGFFNINIPSAQNALLSIPGVKTASIRRVFPDTVKISITEQNAIARWAAGGLLADDGTVFTPRLVDFGGFSNKPLFSGQTSDIPDLLNMYSQLNTLLAPYGLTITALSVDPTGDWQFKVNTGFTVELGSQDMISRLQGFLLGYKALLASQPGNSIQSVDLRYRSGFAVKWQQPINPKKTKRSN
jgi:cell division protein FtsQ